MALLPTKKSDDIAGINKKDNSLLAAQIIRDEAPVIVKRILDFCEAHCEDTSDELKFKAATDYQKIILSRMMPTIVNHKHELDNSISDDMANFLIRLANSKGVDVEDHDISDAVEYEVK